MIYVLCPGNYKSGGPELLHQLVYQLNLMKPNSAVVAYYDYKDKNHPYDSSLKHYVNDNWTLEEQIEDKKDNIIIIPETAVEKANNYLASKKYIWWLSVNGYLRRNSFKGMIKESQGRDLIYSVYAWLKREVYNKNKIVENADLNLCQSYYAVDFLRKNNIPSNKVKYLSDYINEEYLKNSAKALEHKKENIVLYNPKKGLKFTKKLISASNFKWIPLVNLTNDQVLEKLEKSKVYVDFGDHPGKDRFPREAAMSGCCIITDKKGAAKFYKDVPIPSEYKYEDNKENIPKILEKIKYCLNNYSKAINDFEGYRNYISSEKELFVDDVQKIFGE